MICKKCGQDFPDDMPKCLWCDAPNEGDDKDVEILEQEEGSVDADSEEPMEGEHPVGNFMWSAALGGPLIASIVHFKALKGKALAHFFFSLVAINFFIRTADRALSHAVYFEKWPVLLLPYFVVYVAAYIVIFGKVGAKNLKVDAPRYKPQEYRRRERWGIGLGIAYLVAASAVDILFLQ